MLKLKTVTSYEDVQDCTVGEVLERGALLCPDKEALVFGAKRINYYDLNVLVDSFAAAISELGFKKGDRIAIDLPNSPELVISFFAAAKLGLIATWLNPLYREAELKFILGNSKSKGIILKSGFQEHDYAGSVLKMKNDLPALQFIIDVSARQDTIMFDDLLKKGAPKKYVKPEIDPREDYVMLIYTSGSTGIPKGAPHTHWQVIRQGFNYQQSLATTADDIFISFLPLYHLFGFGALFMSVLSTQGTLVLMETYDREEAFRLIEREKCTVHHAAPTHYILKLKDDLYKNYDLSSLRIGYTSGYVPPMELMVEIEEKLGVEVSNFWGSSEAGGALIFDHSDPSREKRFKTVGKPIEIMDIKIVDPETRAEKAVGEEGELMCRGPNVIKGYWENQAETEAHFDADGWFATGDLAFIDEGGYVTITGRTKDQINRGGLKVTPFELEKEISKHPNVHEVAIVATPNPVLGENICACVVPAPGKSVTLAEIRDFLDGKIAKNKLPDELSVFDSFPRLVGGVKLNKFGAGGIKELAINDQNKQSVR
ncbi:MAG: class I adenylate-forming enzyme family protein [Dethiobacteria bacterium]|jgi:fatty-acyl-CoA synthase